MDGNRLEGHAELHAVARTDVDELHLDLRGLAVSKVRVDVAEVAKFTVRRGKLVVRTREVIEAGQEFRLTVRYDGKPRAISDGGGDMGWEELDGRGARRRPDERRRLLVPLQRPAEQQGELPHRRHHRVALLRRRQRRADLRRQGAGATTWVYEQAEPMATYLATVQIGRYVAREVPGRRCP